MDQRTDEEKEIAKNETQEFLTLDDVKNELKLSDDKLSDQIDNLIDIANRQITLALLPVVDNIKLLGTGFWEDAATIAMLYFRSLFERRINHNDDEYKSYREEYKDTLKILIGAIKAQPEKSTRTKTAHATASYQSRLLKNIPGMTNDNGAFFD